jgi:hypothetical protein
VINKRTDAVQNMETQLMEANRPSAWPWIAASVVSIGIMVLGLIAAYLDKPSRIVGNADGGADTLLSLVLCWYC